ncbi:hypothetical protein H0W80_04865 [Candidatus Saccharibacteria bacterium]|nr:hypothetical protein [Candidatus Saccharibacteria bacterium]
MEKWGKCPNCGSREKGPVTIFSKRFVAKPVGVSRPSINLYKLMYYEGSVKRVEIFVEAKNPQEARRMLCNWCENEGKSLIAACGLSLRFVRRSTSEEKKSWQKALNREIDAEMYHGDMPLRYLRRNALGQVYITA